MRPGQKKNQKKTQQKQSQSGFCGWLLWLIKWSAIAWGVFLLLLYTGVFTRLGAFEWMHDHQREDGNIFLRGIGPFSHHGHPWGFHLDDLKDGELKGKTIIVTGANTGLGFSSAYVLASKGAHVVLGCRSKNKCEAAAQKVNEMVKGKKGAGEGEAMVMDLGSFASIKKFADEFLGRFDKLDSLMLNAGIAGVDFGLTEQGIETQIGVNHFGHFYLTHLLLPILRESSSPSHPTTLVSVSSAAHLDSYEHGVGIDLETLNKEEEYHRQLAYGQSKLANVLFALELAEKETEKGSNVLVNVIHPGGVVTDLGKNWVDFLERKFGTFVAYSLKFLVDFIADAAFWDSDTASLTQVYAAVGPKLLEEKIHGKYFHPIAQITPPHVKFAHDQKLRKGLWALSEKVVAEFEKANN